RKNNNNEQQHEYEHEYEADNMVTRFNKSGNSMSLVKFMRFQSTTSCFLFLYLSVDFVVVVVVVAVSFFFVIILMYYLRFFLYVASRSINKTTFLFLFFIEKRQHKHYRKKTAAALNFSWTNNYISNPIVFKKEFYFNFSTLVSKFLNLKFDNSKQCSLFLECLFENQKLIRATGFCKYCIGINFKNLLTFRNQFECQAFLLHFKSKIFRLFFYSNFYFEMYFVISRSNTKNKLVLFVRKQVLHIKKILSITPYVIGKQNVHWALTLYSILKTNKQTITISSE
ncbi:hypothetical protein DOY81_002008, partial [Sarcophaga bullata]